MFPHLSNIQLNYKFTLFKFKNLLYKTSIYFYFFLTLDSIYFQNFSYKDLNYNKDLESFYSLRDFNCLVVVF